MHRNITWTSADYHCRYLDAGILRNDPWKPCGGRFGKFLKQLGLEKLPGDIRLTDLLNNEAISFDLCVKVPEELYGYCPHFQDDLGDLNDEFGDFLYYSLAFPSIEINSPQDLLHPYDDARDLEPRFKERFQTASFGLLEPMDCPNDDRRKFIPYEFYFCYWRAYIFVEACVQLQNIERLLSYSEQREVVLKVFNQVNELWAIKYEQILTNLSIYKTARTRFLGVEDHEMTIGEMARFVSQETEVTTDDLKKHLETLLILFERWNFEIEKEGRGLYIKAQEYLRLDIYNLVEWILVTSSTTKTDLFKKWEYKEWKQQWAQLKDVIAFEDFELEREFCLFFPKYSQKRGIHIDKDEVTPLFNQFLKFEAFRPWARAFADMHKALRKDSPTITFHQPRFIEHFLVLTLRTEVLVREFFKGAAHGIEEDHLVDLFKALSLVEDCHADCKAICNVVRRKDNQKKTKLYDKPANLFSGLESCVFEGVDEIGKEKSLEILKFFTARNYFAHHCYLDDEVNNPTNRLAADLAISCVVTIYVVFDWLSEFQGSGDSC